MAPADILFAPLRERLTLLELAREQNVSPPTPWRWAMKGVRGIRLPTALLGNKRITSRSAFLWWVDQITAVANGEPPPVDDERSLNDRLAAAEREATDLLGHE
jgi:hypothetical protein